MCSIQEHSMIASVGSLHNREHDMPVPPTVKSILCKLGRHSGEKFYYARGPRQNYWEATCRRCGLWGWNWWGCKEWRPLAD